MLKKSANQKPDRTGYIALHYEGPVWYLTILHLWYYDVEVNRFRAFWKRGGRWTSSRTLSTFRSRHTFLLRR